MSNKCPFHNLHKPKGPRGFPIVNSLPDIVINLLKFLIKLRERYGDVAKFKVFGFTNYLISNPEDIAQVFKEEKKGTFVKKRFYKAFYPFFGNGLFNSYGNDWEEQRQKLQPFFKKDEVSAWFPIILDETITHFKKIEKKQSEISLEELIKPLIQDTMSRILFGVKPDNEDSKKAILAIENVSDKLADHGLKSFIFNGILNRLPTPGNLKYKESLRIIDNSIKNLSERTDTSEDSLLSLFRNFMTPKELRDQLFTFYFAGQETTISTLLWIFYYLSIYPEYQDKVRSEVLDHWPDKDSISFNELDKLTFLNAVIDESMRLSPAAYLTYRDVTTDTQINNNHIKKDGLLVLSMYVTHRHPELWDKPSCFIPERFIDRKNKGYSFYPYGGGQRMCIGMHLARMKLTTIVALFVAEFKFKIKSGLKVTPYTDLTLKPKNDIKLLVESTKFIS